MTNIYLLASTDTGAAGDLFDMLGIDVATLIFQIIAFLILVVVLGKWVYPIFVGIIDKREADIAASAKAADDAKKAADAAGSEVADMLAEARVEAADIVAAAKTESTVMIDTAEKKAKKKAESIVSAARDDISNEIAGARKELYNEMIDLVTHATEKVVGSEVTRKVDASLISNAVKESTR